MDLSLASSTALFMQPPRAEWRGPLKYGSHECAAQRGGVSQEHRTSLTQTMAPHSSTLAWKIPRTKEPGRLQSMGSLRVGRDLASSLALFTFMHWRRKWQPTPVFLPGESQGQGSLVGCRPWGRRESDTTEVTQQQQQPGPQEPY